MRLFIPDIESIPKDFNFLPSWRDTIGLSKRPDLRSEISTIKACIEKGHILPERFYRKNRHTTPDELLERLGFMHLHLGDPDTRELLYLIQYQKSVRVMEITDHSHFTNKPPGAVLMNIHGRRILEHEERLKKAAEEKKADLRKRLGLSD